MVKLRSALFASILVLITFSLNVFAKDGDADCEAHLTAAVSAAQAFNQYFTAINERLFERGGILTSIQIALLAKEHALLMGPPGNAKSLISDTVLGNITDDKGSKSYYRIQMTPETTMSETHGPIDPKAVFETGVIKRHYDQGMLYSRNVFIDEIFDARANAQRNILGLLNERQHAQGTDIVKGQIETAIGATNRYLDDVYEKAGDDSPKALLDRFSFNIYVPGEFQFSESYSKLIASAGKTQPKLPTLTFQQLEALRALSASVTIPHGVSEFLSLMSYRIKTQTEAMEQAALKIYRKKQQNGENPAPPYRATKYHSPRTLDKAAKILKAIVVQSWIQSGGKRPLTATVDDLKALKSFFTLSGPEGGFTQELLDRTVNPFERSQLSAILQENQLFDETYVEIAQEMNEIVYQYALAELDGEVSNATEAEEKKELIARMSEIWLDIKDEGTTSAQALRTGKDVGLTVVTDFLESKLHELVGDKFAATLQAKADEIAERKRQEVLAAKRAEEEAIAEQKRQELEARRAQEAAERQERIDSYMQNQFVNALKTGTGLTKIAEVTGAQVSSAPTLTPGYMLHNPMHVTLKDQILVLPPGDKGLRLLKDGKTETIVYENISDHMLKAMFTAGGERFMTALDENRFLIKRGNVMIIANARKLTTERLIMLESDGKFAVDPERKFAINLNMAANRLERIDLASGAVEQIEGGTFSNYANQFNSESDILLFPNKDTVMMSYTQGRYMQSHSVVNNQDRQFQIQHNGSHLHALVPTSDGKQLVGMLMSSSALYYVNMSWADMLTGATSSAQFQHANLGMSVVHEMTMSPTGTHIAVTWNSNEAKIVDTKTNEVTAIHSPDNFLHIIQAVVWLDNTRLLLKGFDQNLRNSYQIVQVKPPSAEELKRIAEGQ